MSENFDNANTTSFLVRNKELMEKCNKICDNVSNIMKKGFNSEPVYSNKYFKAETESYKSIQIFMIVKYLKKDLCVRAYQK